MTLPTPEQLIAAGLPVLYSPARVVELDLLPGVTANWLKRQAGLGRIPCTRAGRTVMFGAGDISEIARMGAQKPKADAPAAPVSPIGSGRKAAGDGRKLQAREPRRGRRNAA